MQSPLMRMAMGKTIEASLDCGFALQSGPCVHYRASPSGRSQTNADVVVCRTAVRGADREAVLAARETCLTISCNGEADLVEVRLPASSTDCVVIRVVCA